MYPDSSFFKILDRIVEIEVRAFLFTTKSNPNIYNVEKPILIASSIAFIPALELGLAGLHSCGSNCSK